MCDLNERITAWRSELSARLSAAELDELEDHLRETLAGLPENALSPDERWLVATRRLGAPGILIEEYAKANPGRVWCERVLWMLVGIVGLGVLGELLNSLGRGLIAGVWRLGGSASTGALAASAVEVVLWLLVAWLLATLVRGTDSRMRGALARLVAWLGRQHGSLKAVLVLVMVLIQVGLPTTLIIWASLLSMSVQDFGKLQYAIGLQQMAMGVAVRIGLLTAMFALASTRLRRVGTAHSFHS